MNVFELFAKLGLDTTEYDKGLDTAEKQAGGFGSKLKAGLGTAAKVGGAAIMAVGTAAVVAGKELVKQTGEVAAYGDNIDKMSQKMGISAEAYQEWDAVMQHSGTSMESLKASMKTMANAAEKGNEAFQKLGISEEEVANLSQEDLFDKVISGLQNMEEGTERTYIAGQLLGRGATELGALLNQSAEETQAMKDRVHELGGVMSDEAVKAAAKYQDTLQDMQTGFDSLKRNLVSEFLPGITMVMDGLTAFTTGDYDLGAEKIEKGIDDFIQSAMDKTPKFAEVGFRIISAIATSTTENAPKLLQMGADIIVKLINGINGELPTLLPAALNAVIIIAQAIINNAPILLESLLTVIQTIKDFILTDGLPMLIEALPEIIVGIIDFILSASTEITEAVLEIILAIMEMAPDIIILLVSKLPMIITGIITAILKNAQKLSDAILQLTIMSLVIVPMIIVEILSRLPEIFTAIVNGFKENWPQMKQAGFDAFEQALTGMFSNQIIQDLSNGIAKLIVGAVEKIKSFANDFKQAGQDVMNGLISGINDKIQSVMDTVTNIASTVSGAFKGALGIASPSKLFAEYGKFIDMGLANGVENNMGIVDRAMDSLYTNVKGSPTLAVAGGGGAPQQIVIPIYIGQDHFQTLVVDALNQANDQSGGR